MNGSLAIEKQRIGSRYDPMLLVCRFYSSASATAFRAGIIDVRRVSMSRAHVHAQQSRWLKKVADRASDMQAAG